MMIDLWESFVASRAFAYLLLVGVFLALLGMGETRLAGMYVLGYMVGFLSVRRPYA